jgi:hypothetical protein
MFDPFLIKHQNVLLPYIKSELCKAINNFLQVAIAGVSVEEILSAVKETSNKKRLLGTKSKRSSQ